MTVQSSKEILRLERICLRFGAREVIRGVDLTVREGEVVVLIGASGSGKTSLLRCVNLLNTPSSGRIVIDDDVLFHVENEQQGVSSVNNAEVNRIRAKTGMVFQQFNLFPHMTALENVMEGPVIVKREKRGEEEKNARALLCQMGLEGHEQKRPSQLSGGQQQRVAIARAARHASEGDAVRRADIRARSGTRRRGAQGHGGAGPLRHDHGGRHPRTGLRLRDRGPRGVSRRGPGGRRRTAAGRSAQSSHPRLKGFVNRFHETAEMLRPFLEAR